MGVQLESSGNPVTRLFNGFYNNEIYRYHFHGVKLVISVVSSIWFFFYFPDQLQVCWEWLLDNTSYFFLRYILQVILHTAAFASSNFLWYLVYHYEPKFMEQFRANNRPWPWQEDREKWMKLLKKTCFILFINHFVVIPVLLVIDYRLEISGSVPRMPYQMDSFPSKLELFSQFFFCMIMEDLGFYWSHRFLHWRRIYPYIHKIHHEYKTTIGLTAEYAHPIEYILGNVVPAALGVKLLGDRVHLFTYYFWLVYRLMGTYEGHSGYDLPWLPSRFLPGTNTEAYHDFHHSHNVGNFGSSFVWWDSIFGTNKHWHQYIKKQMDADKAKDQKAIEKKDQ